MFIGHFGWKQVRIDPVAIWFGMVSQPGSSKEELA
jgi:hypothetical protein